MSSFLSSDDDGDTEVLFTADYPSSVRFCEDEDDTLGRKDPHRIPGHLDWVATGSALTRSRSMLALSEVDSSTASQSGQLYRVKSYPQLKGHGDKHVRFRARQASHGSNVDSTYSGFSGIDSESSRRMFSSSSKALPIKSKEIYVNFSYFSPSKCKFISGLATTQEDDELDSDSKEEPSSSTAGEGRLNPVPTEGDNSLTASANGEILGVSAVNSNDVSPDVPRTEGEGQGVEIEDLCDDNFSPRTNPSVLGTKSDVSLTLKSGLSLGGAKNPSSLPDLTISPVRTNVGTPVATGSKPFTNHLESSGIKTSRPKKKRVTIPSQGPGELHESSVFSSTRYGPIVSAAESTTLSYVDSDQDVTDSGSSSSTNVTPLVENLSQR